VRRSPRFKKMSNDVAKSKKIIMKIKYFLRKKTLFILFFAVALQADTISYTFYNDFFGGTDGHFTNGASLVWLEDGKDKRYTDKVLALAKGSFFCSDDTMHYNAGINVQQTIVTPENTQLSTPQYNDLPYAGYLSISSFLFKWDKKGFTEYSIEAGIIGKYSGAEFVQKTFHKIIGSNQPQGWDTQLSTQFTLNLLLQHGTISWQGNVGDDFQADWFNPNFAIGIQFHKKF